MAFARPSYAMQHSAHGVAGADGGREKYPLNTSQKKKFTLQAQQTNILKHPMKNTL
jgi:hypothetical protein